MKKLLIVLPLIAIIGAAFCGVTGCGMDPSEDNHGYGWEYDAASTVTGIKMRDDSSYPFWSPPLTIEEIDAIFDDVHACVQHPEMPNDKPFIIVLNHVEDSEGSVMGRIFYDTKLILLDQQNGKAGLKKTLRHELVHYFGHRGHNSPYFGNLDLASYDTTLMTGETATPPNCVYTEFSDIVADMEYRKATRYGETDPRNDPS